MNDRFRGRYPGGPSRLGEGEEPDAPRTYLPTVEEIEVGMRRATRVSERRRRRRRVWVGFFGALVVAGAIGFGVGRAVRPPTSRDMLPPTASNGLNKELAEQVNRVLVEEWRMEDVQYARGSQPQPGR